MRLLTFLLAALLCNIYGLAFDLVLSGSVGEALCSLLPAALCQVSSNGYHWMLAVGTLMLLPAACLYLARWLSEGLRLTRYSVFVGLLLVTA